jgi:hypothetical protein
MSGFKGAGKKRKIPIFCIEIWYQLEYLYSTGVKTFQV